MKKIMTLVFTMMLSINLCAAEPRMQSIGGSFAFPIDEDQVAVRVSIKPNDLNIKGDIKKTMNQFNVVICVGGQCEFAHPNTGLGFFEAKFPVPKLEKGNKFKILTIACSRLGCVKSTGLTRVIYPQDKF